jgi:hypothetical protein
MFSAYGKGNIELLPTESQFVYLLPQESQFAIKIISRMVSTGMLRRVALVRTYVSKELNASLIRVTRISELGTTLAVTRNRRTMRR